MVVRSGVIFRGFEDDLYSRLGKFTDFAGSENGVFVRDRLG